MIIPPDETLHIEKLRSRFFSELEELAERHSSFTNPFL